MNFRIKHLYILWHGYLKTLRNFVSDGVEFVVLRSHFLFCNLNICTKYKFPQIMPVSHKWIPERSRLLLLHVMSFGDICDLESCYASGITFANSSNNTKQKTLLFICESQNRLRLLKKLAGAEYAIIWIKLTLLWDTRTYTFYTDITLHVLIFVFCFK